MKKIYFVATYTGTLPSKIIKLCTRKKYSHISISLDSDLNELYSFARIHPYNFLIGGFVHESIEKGIFKRFKNTTAAIYSMDVTDLQYKKLCELIEKFNSNRKNYRFNFIGCIAVVFNKKITIKNHYYCAEFVKYLLDKGQIKTNLPEIVKPTDFLRLDSIELVYTGLLRNYLSDKRLLNCA